MKKLKEQRLGEIKRMAEMGLLEKEIGYVIGLSAQELEKITDDEEFKKAVSEGAGMADEKVERAIFLKATGYSHEETKIHTHNGKAMKETYIKHYPPDTTAALCWLRNRKPDQWPEEDKGAKPNEDFVLEVNDFE